MTHTATFQSLYESGIKELVCVLPPNARLSPKSKIAPASRGKSPGKPNSFGEWSGYPWQGHQPTLRDILTWTKHGANVGLQAAHYPAIDIDVTNPEIADLIEAEAVRCLGPAPVRIGRAPKRLLMYWTAEPFPKMQLRFTVEGVEHLVELLGNGQQYVIGGIHPATLEPYTIDRPAAELKGALRAVTREAATSFFEGLADTLEMMGCEIVHRSYSADAVERLTVDQDSLRAPSPELVAEVVAKIPNTNEHFGDRDSYIRMGYAIKAACGQEHEGEALDVWMEWAARWEGSGSSAPDPEVAERDFLRMHAPFEIGWEWIKDTAKRLGVMDTAPLDFDAPGGEAPRPAKPAEDGTAPVMPFSDIALTRRVINTHGREIRWVKGDGWYAWGGAKWARDAEQEVKRRVVQTLAAASAEALTTIEKPSAAESTATRVAGAKCLAGVASILKTDPRVSLTPAALDEDIFLLNTPGGIVDLTQGTIGPHVPERHMTKLTRVAPDFNRPAPRWRQFLKETTGGDAALESYLQRLAGYCLTGSTREQMFAFLHGSGGNGKSLFLNAISEVMGEYAQVASAEVFAESHFDRHPTELAALRGARLVTANETSRGSGWNEQRITSLTGGDEISARFMRHDHFTFRPQFTLLIAGNHAPKLADVTEAIRRRIHFLPFKFKPANPDPHLADKLREEAPSILAWMIEGAAVWFRIGLDPPAAVLSATNEYLAGEDDLLRWIAERCTKRDNASCLASVLYEDFRRWAQVSGERDAASLSSQAFQKALASKGFAPARDTMTGLRSFTGLELIAEFDAEPHPEAPTCAATS